ncbi:YtpI family protein [Thermoflavimicrobium dichotomicum]|uniref:YtpI-like protein n=1 Tax=Thermoflavimicrobium dichotomicum TaxID=46223 RepID=A0A1I3LEP2_9BACL|nr:YtpI family protein [Thermoflavimicrobium dichotomicum]SFI82855.1 YtpI-like protein [Thermoflavimicrobium dichotomicum]
MNLVLIIIITLFILSTFGTIYHSIMKRKSVSIKRQLNQAWMNIYMGILFISIAILLLLAPDYRAWRLVLISLIFLLGMINLYYGIKNKRLLSQENNQETS